jgi:hypothetical protein
MYVIFMEKSMSGKGCPGRTKFVSGKSDQKNMWPEGGNLFQNRGYFG